MGTYLPASRSRSRRDNECGVSRCNGNGRTPHWLIEENNGTTRVASLTGLVDRHRRGDRGVAGSALSTAAATVPVVIFSTARPSTRVHRLIAHGPHAVE